MRVSEQGVEKTYYRLFIRDDTEPNNFYFLFFLVIEFFFLSYKNEKGERKYKEEFISAEFGDRIISFISYFYLFESIIGTMNRVVNGKLVLKLKEIIDDETEILSGTDDEFEVKWQNNLV